MKVDIAGVKAAIDYYNSNSKMEEVLQELNSVIAASSNVTNFPYGSDLNRIKSQINDLNIEEFSMLSTVAETYNQLIFAENGYNPTESESVMFLAGTNNGEPLELTNNRIIYLTFQLTKDFEYSHDQKNYLKKLGYNEDDIALIMENIEANRQTFSKYKFESISEVHAFTKRDSNGEIVTHIPFKYLSKEQIDEIIASNPYYSEHPEKSATAKKALYVYDYLTTNFSFTDAGAKAVITNIMHESPNIEPTTTNSQGAYGICQWLDRKDELFTFATENEMDVNSIDTQLEFMYHELNTNPHYKSNLLPFLNGENGEDYRQAAMKFCAMYEIPSNDPVEAINIGYFRANDNPGINQLIDDIFN